MKKILQLSAIVISSMTLTSYTFAAPSSSTGVIRFSGSIVEPVCDVTTRASHVAISCERQGQIQTLQMKEGSQHAVLPQGIGSVSTKNLGSDVRITIVSYE
ncbi:hypothetical protein [Pectobacterium fontis]|uniref:hypothetical protein n=1 Tax=Pectobacterium fontis TaxID=2558042 RepID=UPI0009077FD5|nr:hypothetical protein [Pectobacterium fontis]